MWAGRRDGSEEAGSGLQRHRGRPWITPACNQLWPFVCAIVRGAQKRRVRISASPCLSGAGTKSRTRDPLITIQLSIETLAPGSEGCE